MARSMGLDVGKRRIGVSVSDTQKVIAKPVGVIDRHKQDAIGSILTQALKQQADEIVVGYPYHANGNISEQALTVERFVSAMRRRIQIPIVFYDERYSTVEAIEILGAKRRPASEQSDDAIAAAVILQRYLDSKRAQSAQFSEEDWHDADV